ncbi:MAG: hypothetical protein WDN10_00380 [bacterium]
MNRIKPTDSFAQADIDALCGQYRSFIEKLRARWLRYNNHRFTRWVLYELDAGERQRVDGVIRRWEEYITPIAEKWWKRYGIGIRWPAKSSDPCQFYWLEGARA